MMLVTLLRTAWIAGTLPILLACIPSPKLDAFHNLLLGFAKRGKTMHSSSRKFTVPQKYFIHFYILAVIWTSILLATTWHYAYRITPAVSEPSLYSSIANHLTGSSYVFSLHKSHSSSRDHKYCVWQSVFMLVLMEVQVVPRLFESLYVFKYSPSARMHILGYLTGLFFYTAAPLSLCGKYAPEIFKFVADLVAEFVIKGKDRMQVAEFDWWGHLYPLLHLRWYIWIGGAIFLWGWIHQRRCHTILGSLRENEEKDEDYSIPNGDWFKYISSPHYLAEIVIYAGIVIASGCSDVTIWLLFVFAVANLAFAAKETHNWYLQKFDNYPKDRTAIFPFIY
ncbi:polyprenol reductase 2 [Olea europaea subsp. europaea]|uniref:Polyprenol reductase 2 n=1 Tax=Olea europaea subsp. europaea TaxID=158383 RepID=A0A8S0PDI5_OLEEU|nr:polyprenol reductase 2 [Olea europaea subsp. europaea]